MPERLESLVQSVMSSGQKKFHEAVPADFGPPDGRRVMFVRCIETLLKIYPVSMEISGERAALIDMGLIPNGEVLVGGRLFRTVVGSTEQLGTVRLTFSQPTV